MSLLRIAPALALLCAAASLPAAAASSAASSASESVSTSSESASASLRKSSNSSSNTKDVANGDYQVIDMAAAPERPGMLRVRLQAVATPGAQGALELILPEAAARDGQLAQGHIVTAQQRPYGVEFAATQTRQAFFLVLSDEFTQDLPSRAVTL